MIIYIIVILIVAFIIYLKKNEIKRYLDREMSNIKNINDINEETKELIDYYSTFSTKDLMDKLNSTNLNEKEVWAIKKVLNDKQTPTPTGF